MLNIPDQWELRVGPQLESFRLKIIDRKADGINKYVVLMNTTERVSMFSVYHKGQI